MKPAKTVRLKNRKAQHEDFKRRTHNEEEEDDDDNGGGGGGEHRGRDFARSDGRSISITPDGRSFAHVSEI